ncbi:alpha/beta hydrolase domain-containing protein [Thalassotalea crassostreae]|uniref:alpha/beta hydrolase domain-containing protein n=1 Tax=Thalassotalea crassostreae TaxID=1763536 RepID=UPI0008A42BA5|nr:alpha/beta hydrolase domain-containing protein [Thalassotalea crassostreae]
MKFVQVLLLILAGVSLSSQAAIVKHTVNSSKTIHMKDMTLQVFSGEFYFEFDPNNAVNKEIVDIELAIPNAEGMVSAKANYFIIQPKNPKDRRGAIVEVSNRGGKSALSYFNLAPRVAMPDKSAALGDGLIQELGLSLVWVGWQGDVPHKDDLMYAELPRIIDLEGWVRSDWTVDNNKSLLTLAHRDNIETIYPVDFATQDEAWLTKRMGRDSLRAIVPRNQWQFSSDGKSIVGDFSPGIYELVYPARDPQVAGIGLAIIRDTAAYIKEESNPFYVPKAIAYGVSQTGRFLRHFLHQGFNETEDGIIAYDGMFIHTAGAGRGSFNHRFAQPSRDAHRMSAFFYPTDVFPFTSQRIRSDITNQKIGLLKRNHEPFYPKIFYTNTGYEYWGRAAGLTHSHKVFDMAPLENERIFHLASAQHFVESTNNIKLVDKDNLIFRGNNLNFKPHLRSLLSHLSEWVIADRKPPKSKYPRFADQTLTNYAHFQLPNWLGVEKPFKPHTAYEIDYGKNWHKGVIDNHPPVLLAEILPPVPKLDNNGHELGGISHPLLKAPIATFMPWVLRYDKFSSNEIEDFRGAIKQWKKKRILSRYANKRAYMTHLNKMILKSLAEGWILARDVSRIKQQGSWLWDWSMLQKDPVYEEEDDKKRKLLDD